MRQGRNMFLVPTCTVGRYVSYVGNIQKNKNKQSNKGVHHKKGITHVLCRRMGPCFPWLMVTNNPKAFIALKKRLKVIGKGSRHWFEETREVGRENRILDTKSRSLQPCASISGENGILIYVARFPSHFRFSH
jgi:hypothetical protein